jgi:hypothetical protein
LLILADGDSKLSLCSYGLSCTLANRRVVERMEETVRHEQLGPQQVAEPVEIREASEVEDIGDGLVQRDILGGIITAKPVQEPRCGEGSFAVSIKH